MKVYITEEQLSNIRRNLLSEMEIPWDADKENKEKANLILLYDHEQQKDIFFIKNPSKELIDKIALMSDKEEPSYDMLQKYFYHVNTDNIIEMAYDDESVYLEEHFCSVKEFFKHIYEILTEEVWIDNEDSFWHKGMDNYTKDYCDGRAEMLRKYLNNDKSPIEYFFTFEKWEMKDEGRKVEKLKKMKSALKSFDAFVKQVKSLYHESYCDCDSSRAEMIIDLKKEKMILGPNGSKLKGSETRVHFINSYEEYAKEMAKLLKAYRKKRKEYSKKWEKENKGTIERIKKELKDEVG